MFLSNPYIYPKMKGLLNLHFAEGKTEAKELPCVSTPHSSLGPWSLRLLPGHVALPASPLQASQDHTQGF